MSTVESIEKYFRIRGIADDIALVSDSQDIDSLADYIDRSILSEYGSFLVYSVPGEIVNVWGVSSFVARDTSLVDHIYSAAMERQRIKRQHRKPVKPANVHYCVTAGMHGYMPNYLAAHETYQDAVSDLASLHELGVKRTRMLRKDSYLELNLHRDGNEYCEIAECDCGDIDSHNE